MIGETLSGRFRIERLLGRGGMSSVWQAYDEELGRPVAIKLLHARRLESADSVDRFEREARTLALLAHPGIVTVIDRGETDGRPFIVCELVDGRDLHERIALEGPLPIAEALAIAVQVAAALAYAHERGVIHRDVKPHNVLLTADGHAKLTDFGIARVDDAPALTNPGRVLGTGDYVAPEQAQGHPLDGRADIYALGALLYHCLTGGPPYRGASFVEIAEQHLRAPVPDVQARSPDVSDGVAAIVARALAKRREDRFADVGEMQAALEDELLALTRDDGSDTAEVPLVATALEVADPAPPSAPGDRRREPAPARRARERPAATPARPERRVRVAFDAQRLPRPHAAAGPGRPPALADRAARVRAGRGHRLGRLPRQQPDRRRRRRARRRRATTTATTTTTTARRRPLTTTARPSTASPPRATTRPPRAATATSIRRRRPTRSTATRRRAGAPTPTAARAEFAGIKPGVGLILAAPRPSPRPRCACRRPGRLDRPRLHGAGDHAAGDARRLDARERAVQRAHACRWTSR